MTKIIKRGENGLNGNDLVLLLEFHPPKLERTLNKKPAEKMC